jgi:pimeloyl-ACP methyl ester carboxylesterase
MGIHAKNGTISLGTAEMDYIRFGSGKKTLIILPGLGESLQSIKGTALPMAVLYRRFAKDYTVYSFGRKRPLPEGYTTEDMARDQAMAMDAMGIDKADLLGVSMGGMIAQHLAADAPEKIGKLVLVVTAARPNPILTASVTEWIGQAKRGEHTALMDSNVRQMYSPAYYRKNRWLVPIVAKMTRPRSYQNFLVQANACLCHDAYDKLPQIRAAALVIGGEKDLTLGGDASREIAGRIEDAALKMYAQWGHALYDEAKDFQSSVLEFLQKT